MKATHFIAVIALAALAGCAEANEDADVGAEDSAGMAGMQHDSMMMGHMSGPAVMTAAQHDSMMMAMESMPGDVQFMGMMTNHHEGLIAMGSQAMDKASDDSVKTAAHNLHTKQQKERDEMLGMMSQMGMAQHKPMMMEKNKAQLDSLTAKTGKDYDRYFLETTIKHHQEAIGMIDEFLPKMKDAKTKQLAERMKSDQQKEIRELQGKLKTL